MESLQIYKSPYEKKRIGRNRDGGYVIAWNENLKYDLFLSAGISNDISFEEDFINRYGKECIFFAYDGSINKLPKQNSNIQFFKKMINPFSDDKNTDLKDVIQNSKNIFLKMDIEGAEINWLNTLSNEEMNKFRQITIEFHWNVDFKVLEKINQTHSLIHLHGNNNSGIKMIQYQGYDQKYPQVFECTYLRKDEFQIFERSNDPIPNPLFDFPNNLKRPDIILCQEPYNNLFYSQPKKNHKKPIQKILINKKPLNKKHIQQKHRNIRVFNWTKKRLNKKK